jgi:hypothetical protein
MSGSTHSVVAEPTARASSFERVASGGATRFVVDCETLLRIAAGEIEIATGLTRGLFALREQCACGSVVTLLEGKRRGDLEQPRPCGRGALLRKSEHSLRPVAAPYNVPADEPVGPQSSHRPGRVLDAPGLHEDLEASTTDRPFPVTSAALASGTGSEGSGTSRASHSRRSSAASKEFAEAGIRADDGAVDIEEQEAAPREGRPVSQLPVDCTEETPPRRATLATANPSGGDGTRNRDLRLR